MSGKGVQGSSAANQALFPEVRRGIHVEQTGRPEKKLLDLMEEGSGSASSSALNVSVRQQIVALKKNTSTLRTRTMALKSKQIARAKAVGNLADLHIRFFMDSSGAQPHDNFFRGSTSIELSRSSPHFRHLSDLIGLLNVVIRSQGVDSINDEHKGWYYKICQISMVSDIHQELDAAEDRSISIDAPNDIRKKAKQVAKQVRIVETGIIESMEHIYRDLLAKLETYASTQTSRSDAASRRNTREFAEQELRRHEVAESLKSCLGRAEGAFCDSILQQPSIRKLLSPICPCLDWVASGVSDALLQEETQGRTFLGRMVQDLLSSGLQKNSPLVQYKGWTAYELHMKQQGRAFFGGRSNPDTQRAEWVLLHVDLKSNHRTRDHESHCKNAIDRVLTC